MGVIFDGCGELTFFGPMLPPTNCHFLAPPLQLSKVGWQLASARLAAL
jgi:hypothetical protein